MMVFLKVVIEEVSKCVAEMTNSKRVRVTYNERSFLFLLNFIFLSEGKQRLLTIPIRDA